MVGNPNAEFKIMLIMVSHIADHKLSATRIDNREKIIMSYTTTYHQNITLNELTDVSSFPR